MCTKRITVRLCFLFSLPLLPVTCAQAQNEPVLTWHNDIQRHGANRFEQILTPANVNSASFGKTEFFATDGAVDAQPLYVPAIKMGGASHNVLYIVTENDSVYAFDAATGAVLWHTSVLLPEETPSDDRGCAGFSPQIGITSTPVIDLTRGPHGAIYVVNMSKDASGYYHQRINALDLVTGGQLFGGPTHIHATYPRSSSDVSNLFEPSQYTERAALLEWKGAIYTAWTSHCDHTPYTGWVIGYDASTLKQSSVLNLTPNGSEGAIWMSGAGPAANASQILFLDANGTFDTELDSSGNPINQNYGNGFLELTKDGLGLKVHDYYETDDTVKESAGDVDLGSGGALILSPIPDDNGNLHTLAVGAGKDHNIYVVDTNNLGKYHPNGGYIYQVLTDALPHGEWASPAYVDGHVYYGGVSDSIKAFSISNAKLVATPSSKSTNTFPSPGATPSISSNGTTNGILWAVGNSSPPVLYAYHAEDLSEELYDSAQNASRDLLPATDKFVLPTITNGRVFVGTQTGVAVYGVLSR